VLLACACGAAVHAQPSDHEPPSTVPSGSGPAAVPPAEFDSGPAFDSIGARGASLAPGMRELARRESTGDPVEIFRAQGRDACVRVAYEANVPITAKLVDQRGTLLASSSGVATQGALGERGPVCVRDGDSVNALSVGPRARVRWITWGAP
jgi:hypothetical protein